MRRRTPGVSRWLGLASCEGSNLEYARCALILLLTRVSSCLRGAPQLPLLWRGRRGGGTEGRPCARGAAVLLAGRPRASRALAAAARARAHSMVRRTAAQVAHRLTVHLSNRYVRAQVATRGDGRVVAAATSIERPLREAWDNTADRHAARRIGACGALAAATARGRRRSSALWLGLVQVQPAGALAPPVAACCLSVWPSPRGAQRSDAWRTRPPPVLHASRRPALGRPQVLCLASGCARPLAPAGRSRLSTARARRSDRWRATCAVAYRLRSPRCSTACAKRASVCTRRQSAGRRRRCHLRRGASLGERGVRTERPGTGEEFLSAWREGRDVP